MHTISLALIYAAGLLVLIVRLLVAKGGVSAAARAQIIERRTAAILLCGVALAAILALAVIVSGFDTVHSASTSQSHTNHADITSLQP
jgi:hypothetical protein